VSESNKRHCAGTVQSHGVGIRYGGTNIDDLEWPWTPKIGVYSEFLAIFGCNTHFKSELRRSNHSR